MNTVWPNFFIAGAPKAGTTALYWTLSQHPQIYLSPLKEPCFFAAEDLRDAGIFDEIAANQVRNRPLLETLLGGAKAPVPGWQLAVETQQYLDLFRGVRKETAIGEASVPYFYLPRAAGAIAARVPHARLIFLLRDPAERMFSQYITSGFNERPQSFRERFLAAASSRNSLSWWIDSGRYATNLGRFFDHFPRAQIQIHLYERYAADPSAVLRDAFGFLGVDAEFRADVSQRHNEPPVARFPLVHFLHRRMLGNSLSRFIPEFLRPPLRRIYYRRHGDVRMDPRDRSMVIDHFREEIERTASMIGRDLSTWLR